MFRHFLRALKEPSTMAGLSMFAVLFGLAPATIDLGMQVLIGITAAGAIILPETGG